jgi:hypothetical protein
MLAHNQNLNHAPCWRIEEETRPGKAAGKA